MFNWEKRSYTDYDAEFCWIAQYCIVVFQHKKLKQVEFIIHGAESGMVKTNSDFESAKIEAINYAIDHTEKRIFSLKQAKEELKNAS